MEADKTTAGTAGGLATAGDTGLSAEALAASAWAESGSGEACLAVVVVVE